MFQEIKTVLRHHLPNKGDNEYNGNSIYLTADCAKCRFARRIVISKFEPDDGTNHVRLACLWGVAWKEIEIQDRKKGPSKCAKLKAQPPQNPVLQYVQQQEANPPPQFGQKA